MTEPTSSRTDGSPTEARPDERAPTGSPADDESFDAVTVVNGVQYGSDDVLRETARVMRPGATERRS